MNKFLFNISYIKWIIVNSNIYVINSNISIYEFLSFLKYNHPNLVVEHNLEIVTNFDEKHKNVENLDQLEFITIVGGG